MRGSRRTVRHLPAARMPNPAKVNAMIEHYRVLRHLR